MFFFFDANYNFDSFFFFFISSNFHFPQFKNARCKHE